MLSNLRPGDEKSTQALMPLVYSELRALAASYLNSERCSHTLQPTALVHEAFLKMVNADREWSGRDHFFAIAATVMRQVLVDHARAKQAKKRGGAHSAVQVAVAEISDKGGGSSEIQVLELDELLSKLAAVDARAARIAELRLFGGMELTQIATVLGLSRTSIVNEWQFARAWLTSKVKALHA